MSAILEAGDEQKVLWNGTAGRAWVDTQELLDQVLRPFEDLLVEKVSAVRPARVLDVGCGTGSTTLATARLLGEAGRCVGIDISEPMIELARKRAQSEALGVSFIQADAQSHVFEPASFDMIISRFGVMFFSDSVQAFANLRRASRPDAGLCVIAWRGAKENPFMTTAERAAAPFLPNIPPRLPDEPGQFAFANRDRVHRILQESGWSGIDISPVDRVCTLPESELETYFSRLGPLGQVLDEADEPTRRRIVECVRAAFDPYVQGAEVRFTAACWTITARSLATPGDRR